MVKSSYTSQKTAEKKLKYLSQFFSLPFETLQFCVELPVCFQHFTIDYYNLNYIKRNTNKAKTRTIITSYQLNLLTLTENQTIFPLLQSRGDELILREYYTPSFGWHWKVVVGFFIFHL